MIYPQFFHPTQIILIWICETHGYPFEMVHNRILKMYLPDSDDISPEPISTNSLQYIRGMGNHIVKMQMIQFLTYRIHLWSHKASECLRQQWCQWWDSVTAMMIEFVATVSVFPCPQASLFSPCFVLLFRLLLLMSDLRPLYHVTLCYWPPQQMSAMLMPNAFGCIVDVFSFLSVCPKCADLLQPYWKLVLRVLRQPLTQYFLPMPIVLSLYSFLSLQSTPSPQCT